MLNNLKIFSRQYGAITGLKVYCQMKFNTSGTMKLPKIKYPIHFKPKTIDEYTIIEIFGEACYDIDFDFKPQFIIDAGANIGLGSVYFANRYPEAQILAIEPESNNFDQLLENCQYYTQIKPVKSALWHSPAYLAIEDNGYGTRGFMVKQVDQTHPEAIKAVAIEDLIHEGQVIDILKLDIEGSEKALFEKHSKKWLPRTRALIVEFHDDMVPGCSDTVYAALKQYNFKSFKKAENEVFINQDLA